MPRAAIVFLLAAVVLAVPGRAALIDAFDTDGEREARYEFTSSGGGARVRGDAVVRFDVKKNKLVVRCKRPGEPLFIEAEFDFDRQEFDSIDHGFIAFLSFDDELKRARTRSVTRRDPNVPAAWWRNVPRTRCVITGDRHGELLYFDLTRKGVGSDSDARVNYAFAWTITGARNAIGISYHYRVPGRTSTHSGEWLIEWTDRRARR